jgi:cation:H+ antiporter
MKELKFKDFIKDLGVIALSVGFILIASGGIVKTAVFLGTALNMPLILVGILVVGLGNAVPEIYFGIVSARREQNWMVLGDLMGSVISCATIVLGVVALIEPIKITSLPAVAVARISLMIAAIFFYIFIWTGKRISRKEAAFLLLLYFLFILAEVAVL